MIEVEVDRSSFEILLPVTFGLLRATVIASAGNRYCIDADLVIGTETIEAGWNVLVDLDAAAALAALEREPPADRPPLYGDGRAGERVVAALRMPG